jgi:hypothetical protein
MLRILLVLPLVSGCLYFIATCARDPFGATTREHIRSQAAITIAQIEATAQVQTSAIWAGVLPVLALIIVLGVLASIGLYFCGKAFLMRKAPSPLTLSEATDYDAAIGIYAALTNQRLLVHQGEYYLVDPTTGTTVRARPKLPLPPD